ncbi:hypothetical protein SBOR_0307 [Sclerotinia borealis F-4128]|uniref:Uncharacterized protein n=1 Tax=Sclerotinia borealis (strain F-4128) TaxID=1432307 RepID=W9CTQ5_SCLBF|nr:hypothetical protein SBOR_0307 [Sclerotinia borealis F-4128]
MKKDQNYGTGEHCGEDCFLPSYSLSGIVPQGFGGQHKLVVVYPFTIESHGVPTEDRESWPDAPPHVLSSTLLTMQFPCKQAADNVLLAVVVYLLRRNMR